MANFCRNCGGQLAPGAKFCPKCGTKIQPAAGQGGTKIQPAAGQVGAQNTRPAPESRIQPAAGQGGAAGAGAQSTRPARGSRKQQKAAGRSGLSILLAVVMLVEFLIAGLKYPGFLVRKPGGQEEHDFAQTQSESGQQGQTLAEAEDLSTGVTGETITVTFDGEEFTFPLDGPEIEMTPENSPGDPRYIPIRYSAEEIEKAPALTAQVSSEEWSADLGNGIKADLYWWNLEDEPDQLVVKTLPEKTDEDTGNRMIAYDFSLSSGKHEFNTIVELTIPRTANDGNEGGILYYNEKTQEWEPVYYEVSADGGSYLVHMDHFSTVSEYLFGKERELLDKNITNGIFRERDYSAKKNPHAYYTEQELEELHWAENYVQPPEFTEIELVDLISIVSFIAEYSRNSKLLVEDYITKFEQPRDLQHLLDEGSFWFGVGDGTVQVGNQLAPLVTTGAAATDAAANTGAAVSQAEAAGAKALGAVVKSPATKSASGGGFGKALSRAAALLLAARIFLQCFDENLTWKEIAADNAWSLIGVTAGFGAELAFDYGLAAGTVMLSGLSIGIFVCTTLYAFYEYGDSKGWFFKYTDLLDDPKDFSERVYQLYLRIGNKNLFPGQTLYITGDGFAQAINTLYSDEKWLTYRNYDAFTKAVPGLVDGFINEFWALSDDQIKAFIKKNYPPGYENMWERPPEAYIREYKYRSREALYGKIRPILEKLAQEEYERLVLEYTQEMRYHVLPFLNSKVYFVPKDISLDASEDPSHSPYLGWDGSAFIKVNGQKYVPDVSIADAAESLAFIPIGVSEKNPAAYTTAKPSVDKNGKTLYLHGCTIYHYMQIGSPLTFTLNGPSSMGLEPVQGKVNWDKAKLVKLDDIELFDHYVVPVEYDGRMQGPKKADSYSLRVIDETGLQHLTGAGWGSTDQENEQIIRDHAWPANVTVTIANDGDFKVELPEIDYTDVGKDKVECVSNKRDALTLKGLAFDRSEGKLKNPGKYGSTYICYRGSIEGDYSFRARHAEGNIQNVKDPDQAYQQQVQKWSSPEESGGTVSVSYSVPEFYYYDYITTAPYQITTSSGDYSVFTMYIYPESGHCRLEIELVGDMKAAYNNSSDTRELQKEKTHKIILHSDYYPDSDAEKRE